MGLQRHLQGTLHSLGLSGVDPQKAIMGLLVGGLVVLYVVARYLAWKVLGLAAALLYAATQTEQGRDTLEVTAARISSLAARPVSPRLVLGGAVVLLCLAGQSLLGG